MDVFMLILELVGTVAFAISGAMTGLRKGMDIFGVAILGLTTAVGGGVLRDVFSGDTPYIFRKHIYACAAIAGALACALLWKPLGSTWAMLTGCVLVLAIRLLAAHYRWSLPKAHPDEPEG